MCTFWFFSPMVGTSRSNTPSFVCAKETLARNAPEREVVAECVRVGRDDDGWPDEESSEQEVSTVSGVQVVRVGEMFLDCSDDYIS